METNEDITKRLVKIEERLSFLEDKIKNTGFVAKTASASLPQKIISAKEFLIAKKPKDDTQRTFLLGGYLELYEKQESFNIDDLKKIFARAKVLAPSNLNDKVNRNISKGLFMEKESKNNRKAWTLTITGEDLINNFNEK